MNDAICHFILIVLLTHLSHAMASERIDVSALTAPSLSLTSHLALLEDRTQTLTLEDVQKDTMNAQFITQIPPKESINLSYTTSAYWLKIALYNTSEHAIEKILEIDHPLLEHVDFYWQTTTQNDSVSKTIHTGYALPFANRAYKTRIFAFPLTLAPNSQHLIYIRVATSNALVLPVRLWQPDEFHLKDRSDHIFQGMYFGILVTVIVFSLTLAFILKKVEYALYVSIVFFLALAFFSFRGLGSEFIWQNSPWLTQKGSLIFGSLSAIAQILFLQHILNTRTLTPRLNSLLHFFIGVQLFVALMAIVSFHLAAQYSIFLFAIYPFLVLAISIMGATKKDRNAYFLCAGFFTLAVGIITSVLHILALVPTNFFTVHSSQIGSAFELIIFTLLLSSRYQFIYQSKLQSDQALELKNQQLLTEKAEKEEITRLKQTYFEHHFAIDQAAIFAETDERGNITFVNDNFCKISGYTKDELIGSNYALVKSNTHSLEFYMNIWQTIQSGHIWQGEICNRHKSGTLYWVKSVIVPIVDKGQTKPKKYITIRFNITDRKRAEKERAELANQVHQMQRLESIGRLTSGIAHDFNNILGCIMGYNQLNAFIVQDCQDESIRKELAFNVNQIEIASFRAVDLIKKMMAYSRQNPIKKEQDIRPTAHVINEVLDMIRPALTRLFTITAEIDSTLTIHIDATDLHQIITNLLVNARDAMHQKGGVIALSLKQSRVQETSCQVCTAHLDGVFIELSVRDTGVGIDADVIAQIFDPFFTTKDVGQGTGLGLSTVSGMVHEVEGHITVTSITEAKNHGTIFRLLFPLIS